MATQQATPATINSPISVLDDRPSVPRVPLDTVAGDPHRVRRRRTPHRQDQRQHGDGADQADADLRRAPALRGDEILDERRPDRAGEIISAGGDRHRDAAPLLEPVRDVGHDRAERARRAEAEQALRQRELPDVGGERREQIAGDQRDHADQQRTHDAEPVGEAAHHDAAGAEADHGQRERQRGVAARNAEVGLHRGQRDHSRPHADAADRAERERGPQPPPCIGGVDVVRGAGRAGVRGHDGDSRRNPVTVLHRETRPR